LYKYEFYFNGELVESVVNSDFVYSLTFYDKGSLLKDYKGVRGAVPFFLKDKKLVIGSDEYEIYSINNSELLLMSPVEGYSSSGVETQVETYKGKQLYSIGRDTYYYDSSNQKVYVCKINQSYYYDSSIDCYKRVN